MNTICISVRKHGNKAELLGKSSSNNLLEEHVAKMVHGFMLMPAIYQEKTKKGGMDIYLKNMTIIGA